MTVMEGIHDGQLRLQVQVEPGDPADGVPQEAWVKFSAVDGSVQLASDDNYYVNYAPENGYVNIGFRKLNRVERAASIDVMYGINMDGRREIVRHVFQPY